MKVSYNKSFDADGTVYTQTLRMNRSELVGWNSKIWVEQRREFPNKQHYAPELGYENYLKILPQDRSKNYIFLNLTQLHFIRFLANNPRILNRNTRIILT